MLDAALNQKRLEQLVERYRQGLATLRGVAEDLGLSYRKAEALLGQEGVPILQAGASEIHPDELAALARELSVERRRGSS